MHFQFFRMFFLNISKFSDFGVSPTEKALYLGAQIELPELPQPKSCRNIPIDHIKAKKTHLGRLRRRVEASRAKVPFILP